MDIMTILSFLGVVFDVVLAVGATILAIICCLLLIALLVSMLPDDDDNYYHRF